MSLQVNRSWSKSLLKSYEFKIPTKRWKTRKARQRLPPMYAPRKQPQKEKATNPENHLKTAKQTLYSWWKREDYTEKAKMAEPQSVRAQAFPLTQPITRKEMMEQRGDKHAEILHMTLEICSRIMSSHCTGFSWLMGIDTRES